MPHFYWDHAASQSTNRGSPNVTKNPNQTTEITKRDLKLSRQIQRYARYEGMIIDDLGYIRQTREEMEVVFTLLAERYERGSVLLTAICRFQSGTASSKIR